MLYAEDAGYILIGPPRHLLLAHAIGRSQRGEHLGHEGTLVAFAPMRHGRHVRAVRLQDDTVQGNGGRQVFAQMATLERRDAAHAQYEAREAEVLRSRGDMAPEYRTAVEAVFRTIMAQTRQVEQE